MTKRPDNRAKGAREPERPRRGGRRGKETRAAGDGQQATWQLEALKRAGVRPRTVVDVGVGRGTRQLYEAFPDAFHVLIEPQKEYEPHMRNILKSYEGVYFVTAVGCSERSATLSVEPKKDQMSSLYERTATTSTGDPTEKREVPVTTLDALAKRHNLRPPFGLKIDTEGSELEVVKGAAALLRKTRFVVAEVSLTERFVGSYSFTEFSEAMTRNGFFLWDIVNTHERYVDAVFLPSLNHQPTALLLDHAWKRAKNVAWAFARRRA